MLNDTEYKQYDKCVAQLIHTWNSSTAENIWSLSQQPAAFILWMYLGVQSK